jgi:hypothetical protein
VAEQIVARTPRKHPRAPFPDAVQVVDSCIGANRAGVVARSTVNISQREKAAREGIQLTTTGTPTTKGTCHGHDSVFCMENPFQINS